VASGVGTLLQTIFKRLMLLLFAGFVVLLMYGVVKYTGGALISGNFQAFLVGFGLMVGGFTVFYGISKDAQRAVFR
jgi:hypothetical protein